MIQHTATTYYCRTFEEEAKNLADFFALVQPGVRIWTFNGLRFDLPALIQRARYLGVPHPALDIRKYSTPTLIDLWDVLTFGGNVERIMGTGLHDFCARWAIPHDNSVTGKDTARLIAAGDYATVANHCLDDVQATVALAQRLGYRGPAICVDVETVPIDNFEVFLSEPKANGSMKDPVKIEADLAKKRAEQREEAGLDVNLLRIAVLGYQVIPSFAAVTEGAF